MKRMSSIRRPARIALVMVALATLAVVLAACAAGHTASAESATATTPARTTGTQTTAVSSARLPAVIHRGVNLPPPGQSKPVSLVIALHGNGATPLGFEAATQLDKFADRYGFVVAYLDSPLPTWRAPSNIGYISSMITQLTASENIATQRVYLVGFSLGGYATYRAACQLSSQVAAIAVVSNVMAPLYHRACPITRPISQLEIAGTSDLFPVHPTPSSPISADHNATDWRTLDGCSSQSQTTRVGPTVETLWSHCVGGSAVGEYVVQGGIHTWPGSPGRTGADALYAATPAIVAFFGSHPASTVRYANPRVHPKPVTSTKAFTAKFLSVAVRRHGHQRSLHVMLRLNSSARALATLAAHGHKVTSKGYKLRQGKRVSLVLGLPRSASSGRYSLRVALQDSFGYHLTLQRQIRV